MVHTVLRSEQRTRPRWASCARLRRQSVQHEERQLSLRSTLKRYKHLIESSATRVRGSSGGETSIVVVSRVNERLEESNKLLIGEIARMRRRVLELESQALVAKVLLTNDQVKQAIEAKERTNRAVESMRAVALKRAFSNYSPVKRMRSSGRRRNKKRDKNDWLPRVRRSRGPRCDDAQ